MFERINDCPQGRITACFKKWTVSAGTCFVSQGTSLAKGPCIFMLVDGVVDVWHVSRIELEPQLVCTYDRWGQCFGELSELYIHDTPSTRTPNTMTRKTHWATFAARTAAVLFVADRDVLRECMQRAKP
eukprot:5525451-Amphidinium_carterae.1